jgi:lysyl-tRNA synthetase class 2
VKTLIKLHIILLLRVFEIGKLFRNEGIDATHNPEFTSCEFYQAYAGLDDLFVTTQDILRDIVQAVTGGSTVTLQDGTVVDFAQDFQRIEIMPALAEKLGRPLPDPNDDASLPEYEEICNSLHLRVTAPATLPRCLDKLIGHFLEPLCVQPTFLTHHPNCLSPLAKSSSISPGLTQRFELFVGCQELCNAYEELNDPEEQRSRLQKQANMASAGDDEAQPPDEHFCTALSYGLPPTAGWGMGLDRLCMLLTGNMHIREVLLFPVYRPEQSDTDKTDVPV